VGNDVVEEFEARWLRGERPDLRQLWLSSGRRTNLCILSALIKAELRARTEMGEEPDAGAYLERFPELRMDRERVVSLIYEEYCLREELGFAPSPEAFCAQYGPWKDSIASQLRYHQMLSQVISPRVVPRYPQIGEVFAARFRLRSVLGEGGAGRVYLAEQAELGDRAVALKLSPGQSKEPSIQGRLDHEHIVPVWSVVDDEQTGLRGLCMPFRPGRPLDQVIRRIDPATSRPRSAIVLWNAIQVRNRVDQSHGPTPSATHSSAKVVGWQGFPMRGTFAQGVAWLIAKVARALSHAHERGILHRDVKPANILVTVREGPQLLDFNLAHDPHAAEQAEAALRGGTLPYMAPEQLQAFLDPEQWNEVGMEADLYSLGLVLEEMLTGRRPPAPDPAVPLPRAINGLLDVRRTDRPAPPSITHGVPRGLEAILAKCLSYEAATRYRRMTDLADDLERFVARQPLRHVVNPSRRETIENWFYRQRFVLAGGGLLASLLLTFSLSRMPSDPVRLSRIAYEVAITASKHEQARNFEAATRGFRQARSYALDAIRQDPRLPMPYFVLGHLASTREKNHEASLEYYTRAIDLSSHSDQVIPPHIFADLLKNHGAVAYLLAEKQRGASPTAEGLKRASSYYGQALTSLSRAAKAKGDTQLVWRIQLQYILARTNAGLGDAAASEGDWTRALKFYSDGIHAAAVGLKRVALGDANEVTGTYRRNFDETIELLRDRSRVVENAASRESQAESPSPD
jgi:serine/threonine protein kinase